jgi:CubicO group peptidase (beta-lactamase class C family)
VNSFEKKLSARIREEVPDLSAITPGVVIGAWERGRLKGVVRAGETYKYYDLASLTKIIFTATASLHYFSEHRRDLQVPVRDVLEWSRLRATPFEFLSHTAGLEWWLPMYKKLKGPMVPSLRWAALERELAKLKPVHRAKAVYSDPDMWMMGAFLREAAGFELLDLWGEVAGRVGVREVFFHPGNKPRFRRSLYAPTEKCSWRGKVMRGEVHDENCWSLGGVSSHAGLFGTLEGVATWGLELRRAWRGDSGGGRRGSPGSAGRFGKPELVKYFTGRRIPRAMGDWGLGFMKPSRPRASAGRYFSTASFGHTGFTGTSFWFDPHRDLMVVILSNRVHPTRANQKFLQLRPLLHDFVVKSL